MTRPRKVWQALRRYAEGVAKTVLRTDYRMVLEIGVSVGNRSIDFLAKIGNQRALIEVKYASPAKAEQISRAVNQLQAAIASGQGQVVFWTLQPARSNPQMTRFLAALGGDAAKVQFVHGVRGLGSWMSLFFR